MCNPAIDFLPVRPPLGVCVFINFSLLFKTIISRTLLFLARYMYEYHRMPFDHMWKDGLLLLSPFSTLVGSLFVRQHQLYVNSAAISIRI